MATTTFEIPLATLRARRGTKWNLYPPDVLPAWVADMDFRVPEPVREAMQRLVDESDFGYPYRTGDATLATAFQERMRDRFGWEIDTARVRTVTELVQCMFATATAYSAPGDGILLQTPIYPPFLNTIEKSGRRLVENRLKDDGTHFALDVESMRDVVDDRTRLLFLCNPHNPTGRVFTRDELMALGELCIERDIIIVVDEIHADLVYPGHTHIPIASLSPEIAARTVTITSATKGFNIAGLRAAVMYFGSDELEERFNAAVPQTLMGQAGITGIDATIAAWRYGQPWLDDVMQRLTSNRDLVDAFVRREMPGIHHRSPEATYLYWLDCRDLNLPDESPQKFFLNRAKVGLNDGGMFGEAGKTCVRLNFATSEEVLTQVLERMAEVVPR
jgi:cystathionine beta-lyase